MTPSPTVQPTKTLHGVGAFMVGFGASWFLFSLLQGQGRSLPLVGPMAWVSVAVIDAWIGWLVWRTRKDVRERTMDARAGLGRVVLGKTSVMGGTALAGAYGALVVLALPAWPAPLVQDRVLHAGIAIILCAVWAVLGWFLQRVCRVPPGDTPDTPSGDRREG